MSDYRVAVIAPPWYPVPPNGYGGIEVVVDLLVRGLREQGVDLVLYAAEGSAHEAVTLAPPEWSEDLGKFYGLYREAAYLGRVTAHLQRHGADLVHDHSGLTSPLVFAMTGIPTLHTVHGPLDGPSQDLYGSLGDRAGLISISDAQRDAAPDLNWVGTVHNAVDIDRLYVAPTYAKSDYLVCLARISPEKGQNVAIEVARRTGRKLVLAGKVGERDEERRFFDEKVAPFVDGVNVVYIPNVAGRQKAELLSNAYALLSPIQWDEPFGLSMVEAMASGTPVLAFSRGSTPELVAPGVTGFLAKDIDAMVSAVPLVADIEPRLCAARARDQFSPQAMADGYITLYEQTLLRSEDRADIASLGVLGVVS